MGNQVKNLGYKILAIIPARGGSKSIPEKNLRMLCGKPMIAYTIEASLNCRQVDRTIVSTDSEEIKAISEKFGAKSIKRPEELARDDSPIIDAAKHALKELSGRIVALLAYDHLVFYE